jgi:hypothetical protein
VSAGVVSHVACRIGLIRADPAIAPLIAAELAGINQAPVETVVARKPNDTALSGLGLEHPSNIVLLYSRDSSWPVARSASGGWAKDGVSRYARVQRSHTVITIPSGDAAHLGKPVALAGNAL